MVGVFGIGIECIGIDDVSGGMGDMRVVWWFLRVLKNEFDMLVVFACLICFKISRYQGFWIIFIGIFVWVYLWNYLKLHRVR